MPLYDYRCAACGHEVEVMHSVHGTGPDLCERCGGPMRKALSPPAIHFRGSGWAKKDARAASSTKAATASSGKEAGTSEGADASAAKGGAGESTPKKAAPGTDEAGGSSKGTTPASSTT
jgi:putative FmdB family regulatory protein